MNIVRNRATITCVQEQTVIIELYRELDMLQYEYPHFKKWFFEKMLPDVMEGKRKVFIARYDDQLAGVLILKDTDEKKICTLRVWPNFRGIGIGHQLMDCALSVLGTLHPIITVSDNHIQEFWDLLITDYQFKLREIHYGYYRDKHFEFVFNGSLD
jgi:ribosomal protein S18 acetylase RimI-like enzyme